MGHKLTDHDRTLAYQARKLRQIRHDERCRPILERVAGMGARSEGKIGIALRELTRANTPAPRGGTWTRSAVWRIGRRLGLVLTTGRAFGEFPRCPECNAQMGHVYPADYCKGCEVRQWSARVRATTRRLELEEAREKLANLEAKIKTLEVGGRHWTASHPERRQRFGRQKGPRRQRPPVKRNAGQ